VVDSVVNFSPDRIGVAALYQARRLYQEQPTRIIAHRAVSRLIPDEQQVAVAVSLRHRFEEFVQRKCEIPDGATTKIQRAYRTLFNTVGGHVTGFTVTSPRGLSYRDWPMFTTNYDAVLEYYWSTYAR